MQIAWDACPTTPIDDTSHYVAQQLLSSNISLRSTTVKCFVVTVRLCRSVTHVSLISIHISRTLACLHSWYLSTSQLAHLSIIVLQLCHKATNCSRHTFAYNQANLGLRDLQLNLQIQLYQKTMRCSYVQNRIQAWSKTRRTSSLKQRLLTSSRYHINHISVILAQSPLSFFCILLRTWDWFGGGAPSAAGGAPSAAGGAPSAAGGAPSAAGGAPSAAPGGAGAPGGTPSKQCG